MTERDTRARLLEAATEVFVATGYRDAGIREISSRAGVNLAAVNYHFGGKEELYREVLLSAYSKVSSRPMPKLADAPDDPEGCLRRWIEWNVERLMGRESNEVFGVLMGREMQQPSPAFDALVKNAMRPTWMGLVEIVAAWLGREADSSVEMCCMSIFGQCLVYHTSRRIRDRIHDGQGEEFTAEAVADHVITFSFGGLAGVRERGARS